MEKALLQTAKAWVMATRLPTLLIPTIQVWTGTAVAYVVSGKINWLIAFYAWLVGIAITIGTNLINDAIDFEKGGDTKARLGQKKVLREGLLTKRQVYMGGLLALAVACGIPFALNVDALTCFAIVAVCAVCGYCYTGGPYPISYLGLSELFIFIFYGGVCVVVPYYAQTYSLSIPIALAATQMGLLAILPNALNNFRDIDEDKKVSKKTLAVRFGVNFARREIATLTIVPFLLNVGWCFIGYPVAALMPFLGAPLAYFFVKRISKANPSVIINKYFALGILIHFSFGVLLISGLLIG